MSSTLRELRSLASHLGLLIALVLSSLFVYALGSWLVDRGGAALLLLGLTGLWAALLFLGSLYLAHRKRQRDRAIDAALEQLRAALNMAAREDDDKK